ncbi:MAG: YafY family transcriptional regulator [Rhodospirillales bacterium]|jgi:predicted DNA-binding transcriptional regulator YafY|nr:YafY family transcriptional regulator [Rhodospirillales bacterium]MDE2582585.1 YafY family transcriptional regulator [Rhodospirillales bacterium]
MRRADRLFDIIQVLRLARAPITAAAIAAELEVTPRTVYRDIATLQARRVPIEGAAGIGYVLRRGYDLPPLMFTEEEAEAITVGLRLLRRTGDPALEAAARSVVGKLASVLPEGLRAHLAAAPFHVSDRGAPTPAGVDLADIRAAIRAARKLQLDYVDGKGATTRRTVRPIAMEYYSEATLVCAWCELRADYRHFRADRIVLATVLDAGFAPEAGRLRAGWRALTQTG